MAMEVEIPFNPRFRRPMLNATKTVTWRTQKYGDEGDWFFAFGTRFVLTEVAPAPMRMVAEHYVSEGFDSQEDAIQFMKMLRPKTGWSPELDGWHLHFRKAY